MKTTSIKVDEELWKRFKILSVRLNVPMGTLLKDSVEAVVEGGETLTEPVIEEDLLTELRQLRSEGKAPLRIMETKTAVELVREGRGR